VQTADPEAKIAEVQKMASVIAPEDDHKGIKSSHKGDALNYARAVIVGKEEVRTVVNLPPKGQLVRNRKRKAPKASRLQRKKPVGNLSGIKIMLKQLTQVLQIVCPTAVQPLRQVLSVIKPLLQVAMAMPNSPLRF